ncbi:malto-oligosyltrehalose synthase [Streptomyces agglomeratus]|uniref:Malto-oligosyltrehalose synthase n=1 Tax=Streptomyces agglomeratus TaxID=285458 RepID=A0A1E5P4M0_9ACTN|nr:malto-oligosyltrehalose synthase [Streptomyces agglomeratus]OEJ24479.1 malto-oligosyltrehalose synthase [Streptomyces agglomeratus]OEJ41570.1 malto-oligosyltrehalose synthase [Streptomyces agglomeratus]OEJ44052.1 malto-oligosyltrehalose synthase [Streptomyces agglomeratus]OEJ54060.1 malto-oligosyltrehalose synthase [Streptomyces agglomeratus]OEJ61433.1 malto-oligosyltrehalose synthase [Streptomyces agglomeratus]
MTPTATYRLQLRSDFPFSAAEEAVPHLAALGVSHLHLSPVLEAVPGSQHGYDVVDHARVRAELGGEEGLRALSRTARAHGLGLILDIVPNHMAVPTPENLNRPLWEVLREGPGSPYAGWFDIDWEGGDGKVLLPVLAHRIGEELEDLTVDGETLRYYDHTFPLREGTAGLPMPELLDAQWYRLTWWRLARTELNYRRFFTISELIGVRVEDPEVFAASHAKILELVRDGVVEGLRVDHPDGLADPQTYLRRLGEAVEGRWTVVEKILTGGERLPAEWPVAGTTGYDALYRIDGLFTDPSGAGELTAHYRDFAGPAGDRGGYWEATVRRSAYKVLTHELAAETRYLVRTAERICASDPALRDHAPWALLTAVRELLVRVPVYRPYVTAGGPCPESADAAVPLEAARQVKAAFAVREEAAVVDLVRDLALGKLGAGPDRAAFCARFAQTASALRAKSVEDTAFYRYTPLISANEVGGDPGEPGVSPADFHAFCTRLARDWPATGTVLSTHDTKRSADVRARIAVLSECPGRWAGLLAGLASVPGPDAHLAWTAWQTALGFGEPDAERLTAALLKSVREAGLHTSWTEQDEVYERSVADFVAAGPAGPPFETVAKFARDLAPYVRANVLGAALLHLTMPGVPDLYQGTEREFRALVDPDNRRPVDFTPPAPGDDGLSAEKYAVTVAALGLRRARAEVFGESGTYTPLTAVGPAADHCVAFCRSGEAVTAVTRLSLRLAEAGGWRDTALELPEGRWTDALAPGRSFTGSVRTADLFTERPVSLLTREREETP